MKFFIRLIFSIDIIKCATDQNDSSDQFPYLQLIIYLIGLKFVFVLFVLVLYQFFCFLRKYYCPKNPKSRAVLVIRSEDPNYRTDDKRDSNDSLVRSQSSIKSEEEESIKHSKSSIKSMTSSGLGKNKSKIGSEMSSNDSKIGSKIKSENSIESEISETNVKYNYSKINPSKKTKYSKTGSKIKSKQSYSSKASQSSSRHDLTFDSHGFKATNADIRKPILLQNEIKSKKSS